jgi:hypothetical protein
MEEHLFQLVDTYLDCPVVWGHFPEGQSLPRATLTRISGVRDMTISGLGLMTTQVQIDIFGESFEETIGASRSIRSVLEGYRGGPILLAALTAVRDGIEDDAKLAHRVSLTFSIKHRD